MNKTALFLASAALGLSTSVAQAVDTKTVPGYICQPQTSQISDFRYQVGGLSNISFKRRVVVCPIIKDHNQSNVDVANEWRDTEVHAFRAASSVTDFTCGIRVRRLQTGAVLASNFRTNSSTPPGNVVLDFNSLNAPFTNSTSHSNRSSYDVQCVLPEKMTIRGIFWTESDETDVNDQDS